MNQVVASCFVLHSVTRIGAFRCISEGQVIL